MFFAAPVMAQSQTAQSGMVEVATDNTTYQIEGTIAWTYVRDSAEGYYTNALDGNSPTVTCTGSGCTNPPPVPVAPQPDRNKLRQHAQDERCVFFCGGVLGSDSYTQDVRVNISSGVNRGNWRFTYTYNITPNQESVEPHTCWIFEETGGTVDVNFSGFVSSESYLKQSGGRTKYSFTLLDSAGGSRVQSVIVKLQKSDGLGGWTDVGVPISYGTLPVTQTYDDCTYFGNSAVYSARHAAGGMPATLMSLILLEDTFVNNDNDLASGNAHQADYNGTFAGINEAGDYRIAVSGIIKGNSAGASFGFSVGSQIIVIGGMRLFRVKIALCLVTQLQNAWQICGGLK